MAIQKHTVAVLDGSSAGFTDRVVLGQQLAVANAAGGGAGASVTTAITFADPLPSTNYTVLCQMSQDATWYITGKTTTGFNVVMNPRLAANTLASGNFDVTVLAA